MELAAQLSERYLDRVLRRVGRIHLLRGGAGASVFAYEVYYVQLSPTGIGPWKNSTSYPMPIRSESCVTSASAIYCVGGETTSGLTGLVYYAPLSASGIGNWTMTSSYPVPTWTQSCVAASLGVYCVGGQIPSGSETADVYFAPFSASGLGPWTNSSDYPAAVRQQSCVDTSTDIYCVGGLDSTTVDYAPITSSGLGQWENTTGYPFTVGANLLSCTTLGTEVYCVGGHTGANISNAVNYAQLSASGVGVWNSATGYPDAVWGLSCVTSDINIICVGGETLSGSVLDAVSFSVPKS